MLPRVHVVGLELPVAGLRWALRVEGRDADIALFGMKRMADDIAADMNKAREARVMEVKS